MWLFMLLFLFGAALVIGVWFGIAAFFLFKSAFSSDGAGSYVQMIFGAVLGTISFGLAFVIVRIILMVIEALIKT